MNKLIQLDRELFLTLNKLGSETWDGFWMFITGNTSWYLVLLLLVFLSVLKYNQRFWIYILLVLAVYGLTDWVSVHLFKEVFQRLRPCHDPEVMDYMRLVKDNCGGQWGFVSSHASNSMAVAWLAGLLFPIKRGKWNLLLISLIVWACLVSYSRVYIGVHFPGDIIAGAILGKWMALLAYFGFKQLEKKF